MSVHSVGVVILCAITYHKFVVVLILWRAYIHSSCPLYSELIKKILRFNVHVHSGPETGERTQLVHDTSVDAQSVDFHGCALSILQYSWHTVLMSLRHQAPQPIGVNPGFFQTLLSTVLNVYILKTRVAAPKINHITVHIWHSICKLSSPFAIRACIRSFINSLSDQEKIRAQGECQG